MGSVVYRCCLPLPSPHGSPASLQAHTHSFVSAGHRHEMASPGDWRRVKTPTS